MVDGRESTGGTRARPGARPGARPAEAVVVGAGIAGCTLAWELARRGLRVLVLDQAVIAAESSGRNTGTLLTSAQAEVVELLDASMAIYGELADGPVPFEFAPIGHLLIAESEAEFAAADRAAARYRQAGVPMERVTGAELAREHPRVGFRVAGGYLAGRAWTLEPMGATHAFAQAAREAGATFRTGARVAQVMTRAGRVQGVLTDQGPVPADLVFLANGLWMGELLRRTVGAGPLPALPFTAGRGWLIQLGRLEVPLPWIVEELTWPDEAELGRRMALHGLADLAAQQDDRPAVEAICLNPMRGGDARLGASIQPAFRDLLRNTDMASRIAARTLRMLGGLASLAVRNVYPGNRPMLSDGLPVAGRTPVEGLFVHGGLGSIGMAAAPATARWLAQAVLEGNGDPPQPWLRPGRFPGWAA